MIRPDAVFLRNLSKHAKHQITENGLTISRKYLTDKVILINNNRDEVLLKLNNLGIIFGEDYKQGWSPADIMRDLQDKGILEHEFKSIYWTGTNQWNIKDNNKK